ncbi:MAG: cystathionine gamma-synthase [Myxococcota bacterium]
MDDQLFETRAIHAGCDPETVTGSVSVPIFQTSTFAQQAPGEHTGFEYARTRNPTRDALERNLASLEGARHGLCFSSGCAATDAILHCLKPGDHVVSVDDLYGGTYRLFMSLYRPKGIDFTFISADQPEDLDNAISDRTKLIWVETPSNPLLVVLPIATLCAVAKRRGVPVVVDNTFATPYLQQPLAHGATLVLHSVTKYLGGHSDLIGGAVLTSDDEWRERLAFIQNAAGAVPGPFDCFLALRGTKTLHVRMDRHCDNAEAIAEWLEHQRGVKSVIYPGLRSHRQHDIAREQMRRFGGMVSFVLDGDLASSRRFLSGMEVFTLAESLGGVESLIEHPAIMTHASIPAEERHARGIDDGFIRLSVGIEALEDLRKDLERAFARLASIN